MEYVVSYNNSKKLLGHLYDEYKIYNGCVIKIRWKIKIFDN